VDEGDSTFRAKSAKFNSLQVQVTLLCGITELEERSLL